MIPDGSQLHHLSARDPQQQPEELLRTLFVSLLRPGIPLDAQFIDAARSRVVGVAGIPFKAPVVAEMLHDPEIYRFLEGLWRDGRSVLVVWRGEFSHPFPTREGEQGGLGPSIHIYLSGPHPEKPADIPPPVGARLAAILSAVPGWAGFLNEEGHHVIDLKSPSPGPHFFTNLLIGNRIGHPKPLQTTPKSVVDRLGRGSFRSHADTQVLATRWDLRAEENGFPANRQFYLVEDGRQIFYSADPSDPNVEWAQTTHAPNCTTIRYRTRCGLEITRVIFLLPHEEGLPLAVEVHSITVANRSGAVRHLRLVATGMFGPAQAVALREDVLYSNLTLEGRVLQSEDGSVVAISPHYHPFWAQEDVRFHSTVVHRKDGAAFPTEFCTSYNEFVGNGTLEHPEGLLRLSNRLARKGPGFFAVAAELELAAGESVRVDGFTGLVSAKTNPSFDEGSLERQLHALLERFSRDGEPDRTLAEMESFLGRYSSHLQVESSDPQFDCYVNRNLPFQLFYQTFVSRSFDQTQKGHREIGAREIQDLFASMPFFIASGQRELVRDLLAEWASQIFEFGYAYHNFYWRGKQPGEFSDDALWLVQALGRYLQLSGDRDILDLQCDIAGTDPVRRRTIYETVQAILRYSGEISIGGHGLPLLDRADWNDTLQLDRDYLNGPQKEAVYRRQLERSLTLTLSQRERELVGISQRERELVGISQRERELVGIFQPAPPLESHYSESVMNGFLLKVAYDEARAMAAMKGDTTYLAALEGASAKLVANLQEHAWKGDFFARVLFNKFPDGRHSYLGAGGDGLSADPSLDGTYFLNSFTWSVLAGVATEDQIATMLEVVERVLWTPHGLKLCSPVDFSDIAGRGGSDEYFPGDRENGGVFKHADAMAAAAMLRAAKKVQDPELAARLADLAYRVLDVILPYRTMVNPYVLCGNPRFCTQYNNSETGENVGPTVSGTATWLWLALVEAFGLRVTPDEIEVDPILAKSQRELKLRLRTGRSEYEVSIRKPPGFCRTRDRRPGILLDGRLVDGPRVPHFEDGETHRLEVIFP